MRRILLYIIALFFPWLVMFIKDDPGGALIALLLQATIIGWLPATIWAIRVIRKSDTKTEKPRKSNAPSVHTKMEK